MNMIENKGTKKEEKTNTENKGIMKWTEIRR